MTDDRAVQAGRRGRTPAVRYQAEDDTLILLDQTQLPEQTVLRAYRRPADVAEAIAHLVVRGADAIGIAAGYAMVLAVRQAAETSDPLAFLRVEAARLRSARPTAVHLARAVDRVLAAVEGVYRTDPSAGSRTSRLHEAALQEAERIEAEDRAMCRRIGESGAALFEATGVHHVLTHCNAGRLATADYGTATAPLYVLHERGYALRVYADETRPLLQGSRLTTWELTEAGIETVHIVDGAAAAVLAQGRVDAVITGADRIAANGDTANKIGTFGLALAAHALGVPFYVAAPASTFDLDTPSGAAIPIEERSPEEVHTVLGKVRVAAPGAAAYNPAFDVTPATWIRAFITDRGVLTPPFPVAIARAFGADAEGAPRAP